MPPEIRGVTVDSLRPVVAWLDSEQDPRAVVSHHGVGTTIGDFYVRITPGPPFGSARGVVVVFEVREWEKASEEPGAEIVNGIPPEQRGALGEMLGEVAPVIKAWNGSSAQCATCSFHVDREPGKGVRKARANYVPFAHVLIRATGITTAVLSPGDQDA